LAQGFEAERLLDALSKARALDLGLLLDLLATALDAMFSLTGPPAAGFQFVGHGSALPQCFAEESFGGHEPGAYVEDHSLEAPKALGLGREDHVLELLQLLQRWE
jgi:hypothetical protein